MREKRGAPIDQRQRITKPLLLLKIGKCGHEPVAELGHREYMAAIYGYTSVGLENPAVPEKCRIVLAFLPKEVGFSERGSKAFVRVAEHLPRVRKLLDGARRIAFEREASRELIVPLICKLFLLFIECSRLLHIRERGINFLHILG